MLRPVLRQPKNWLPKARMFSSPAEATSAVVISVVIGEAYADFLKPKKL